MGMQLYVTEIIDFLPQSSKMDAPNFTIFFLVTLFAQSSHQWTDHGSTQFLSEGTSTVFEAPGDSSAGCFWIFKSSDTLRSCCYASHDHLCDKTFGKANNCRERADAKVSLQVDGVPACTLTLIGLSEAWDTGNYQAVFPAKPSDNFVASLWIHPPHTPVTKEPEIVNPSGLYIYILNLILILKC